MLGRQTDCHAWQAHWLGSAGNSGNSTIVWRSRHTRREPTCMHRVVACMHTCRTLPPVYYTRQMHHHCIDWPILFRTTNRCYPRRTRRRTMPIILTRTGACAAHGHTLCAVQSPPVICTSSEQPHCALTSADGRCPRRHLQTSHEESDDVHKALPALLSPR